MSTPITVDEILEDMKNNPEEKTETVELTMDKEKLYVLAMEAHRKDVTLNQLIMAITLENAYRVLAEEGEMSIPGVGAAPLLED